MASPTRPCNRNSENVRALSLAEQAIETGRPWVRYLGTLPTESSRRVRWLREVLHRRRLPGPLEHQRAERDRPPGRQIQPGAARPSQASTRRYRSCPCPHEHSTEDQASSEPSGSPQDRERSSSETSKRKQARELARWEAHTRTWALARHATWRWPSTAPGTPAHGPSALVSSSTKASECGPRHRLVLRRRPDGT